MSDDDRKYAEEMLAWMLEELTGDMMVIALAAWAKRYGPQLEARIAALEAMPHNQWRAN